MKLLSNSFLKSIAMLSLILGLCFRADAQLSGNYTINSAVATGGTNYQTFTAAVSALNSGGVSAAVVFNVVQGTYNEQFILNAVSGASATNTITFRADAANTAAVTLTYGGTSTTNNYVIRFDGADFITIEGLELINTGGTYGRVLDFLGLTDNITIRDNYLNNSIVSTTSNYMALVYHGTGSGNMANNFLMEGNTLRGGSYAIYMYGSSSTVLESNNQLINNDARDFYYYGFYCYYQTGSVIDGNTIIANPGASTTNYGLMHYYCDLATVTNNKIVLNATSTNYALYMGYNDGSAATPGLIANNMITCGNNTSTTYGIYVYYSYYQNIYHNSINVTGGSTTAGRGIYFSSPTSGAYGNINVNNNIVVNTGGGYAFERTSSTVTLGYITSMNNNDWYATGTTVIRDGATSHSTLAAWQGSSGFDANSVSIDPGFFAADDLHLNTSAMNNLGATGLGIADDIDGDIRCPGGGCPGAASVPDMGADEFEPIANDAGIMGIASPLFPICAGTYTITAEVGNQGLVNLTSVTIDWSVNGVPQTTVNATGLNIAPGTTGTVVLGNFTFASGITYNIEITSSMPNGVADMLPMNNIYAATTSPAMSGVYSINGAVATGGTNFQTFGDALAALNFGICGPVTINVVQGTYNEQIQMPDIQGTSAANTVVFRADPANTAAAILTYGASGTSDNFIIWFDGTNYVTIDGLELVATGTTYTRVLVFGQNNESINILNNTITLPPSTSTSNYNAAVYHNTGTTNVANHIIFDGNTVSGGSYSMYLYGMSSTSHEVGNRITNNSFTDYYYSGIFNYYQDSVIIENNVIESSIGAYVTQYGLYYYYSDYGSVSGNKIVIGATSTNYGLYSYYSDGSAATPNRFANNMISCLGGTGTTYAMYLYNNTFADVYHNSINTTGGSPTAGYGMYINSTSTIYNNINVKNNIGVNTGGGYALYLSTSATSGAIASMDNNNWFATGTSLVSLAGTGQSDLTTYKSAVAPLDANAISTNPSFAADDDLHVCNGLLNGTGALGTGVTEDIDGDVRCPGLGCPGGLSNPDIGADEFIEPAGDVKPQALLYPEDNRCGQVSQNVMVSIVNNRCVYVDSVAVTVNVSGPLPTSIGGTLGAILLPGDDTASFYVGAIPTTTAGVYTFQIITQLPGDVDASNDTLVVSLTVTTPMIVSSAINDATCQQNDGSVSISQTGGVAPYTYVWNTTQNTASISGLVAGDYVVTVNDAAGCESSITTTVGATTANISSTNTVVDANCGNADGSATISGSGGTAPYSYNWSNAAFGSTVNGLAAGSYDITITDSNGCTTTSSISVGVNTTGNLNVSTSSTNSGCSIATGTATATVSGGSGSYTFIWSNGATGATASGLAAGTYSVTASDAGGCSTVASIMVNNTTDLNATTDITHVGCNNQTNGSIDLIPSGGTAPYSYAWSNGANSQDINNLAGGSYQVTITDNSGCISVISGIDVINPGVLGATAVVSPANGIGFNGSIDVTVTGGTAPFTYLWSDGWIEEDHMNVQSGSYSITITDANGCSTIQSFTVGNTTGVNTLEESGWTVNLYPNPSETQATIDIQLSAYSDVEIRLLSVTGQLLQTVEYTQVENIKHILNVSELPSGVYMLQILGDKQTTTRRLTVKR